MHLFLHSFLTLLLRSNMICAWPEQSLHGRKVIQEPVCILIKPPTQLNKPTQPKSHWKEKKLSSIILCLMLHVSSASVRLHLKCAATCCDVTQSSSNNHVSADHQALVNEPKQINGLHWKAADGQCVDAFKTGLHTANGRDWSKGGCSFLAQIFLPSPLSILYWILNLSSNEFINDAISAFWITAGQRIKMRAMSLTNSILFLPRMSWLAFAFHVDSQQKIKSR